MDYKKYTPKVSGYIPYIIIAILTIVLMSRKDEVRTITLPEKSGSFQVSQPEPITLYDTIKEAGTTKVVEIPNPVNQSLLDKYNSLKDSISKLEQYKEVITERTYKETFKDSIQEITIESEVIGTLKSQKVDYRIYPQTIEVKTKKPTYNVFLGTFTTIPTHNTNAPVIGANISLKTTKNIYQIGYDTQRNITAGISFKLF